MTIYKSEGLTASERYLKQLCERSFLSLWSYPNLYRDQGGGHELCDLLVVFGDDIIIFSDKSCAYPSTGDAQRDWERWFRRAVADSAKQLFGAERWIRQNPHRIFTDQKCTQRFPLDLGDPSRFRFHRIVVALGAGERCRSEMGGSGSLILMPKRSDGSTVPFEVPFSVGWVVPGKPYVHVLDDVTLDILLRELDTVADFTEYLRQKEAFVESGRLGIAPGEEELLALYLRTMVGERHAFPTYDADIVALNEGFWNELQRRPEYRARKQKDLVSYLWDRLIESFSKHLQQGTLARGNQFSMAEIERPLRAMASEHRLARRLLADSLDDLACKTAKNASNTRLVLSPQRPTRAYVLSLVSSQGYEDYEKYRDHRQSRLRAYCMVARHRHPHLEEVVGVGLEPVGSNGGSEDLVFLDVSVWSDEQAEAARKLHEEVGLLKKVRLHHAKDHEFPEAHRPPVTTAELRRQRNAKKRERQERVGKRKRR